MAPSDRCLLIPHLTELRDGTITATELTHDLSTFTDTDAAIAFAVTKLSSE